MKYHAISIEFYRNMKEIEQDKKDLKLILKGLKYGYFLTIFIIIISAFFNGNLVLAQTSNIEFEFENAYAFNGKLPDNTVLENQRYHTEPNGHFPATYSFENDTIGNVPNKWTQIDGTNIFYEISESFNGHNKILNLTDNSGTLKYNISNPIIERESGTIEFWISTTDAWWFSGITLGNDSIRAIYIVIYQDKFQFYNGTFNDIGLEAIDNTWYHVKLIFNCTNDLYDIWINGMELQINVNFENPIITIKKLYFISNTGHSSYSTFYDAIGYSWDGNSTNYDFTSLYLDTGDSYTENLENANTDDTNFFTIFSDNTGEMCQITSYFYFNEALPTIYMVYLSYHLESTSSMTFRADYPIQFDTGTTLDEDSMFIGNPISSIFIISTDENPFNVSVYFLELTIFTPNYWIGNNLISDTQRSDETETDKFEFTFDNSGNLNLNGDDDVNGFSDIENDYYYNDVVNIYDSIDDNVDKCIRINGGITGNVGIERDFDVGVNTSEIWWQFDLIQFGYPENEIYVKIENADSDTIAFFKLNGTKSPFGDTGYADLCYYYNSEWITLQNGIQAYNNFNMTFVLNWTNGNDYGILGFEGHNYPILFENDQNSLGNFQIYGINDNPIIWGVLDLQIDWLRIIINGSSISDELMPDNIFILNGNDFSLLYQSFIEITFDITYDNNISILLNSDIEIIPYIYNATAQSTFFANFYQDKSYSGLFLEIINSSEYKIDNIKIYGIQMINQLDSNDSPLLEFDYSYVNPNESYFYVSGNNLHYYFEADDNGNLEYIQATFNIEDLSCEGYSIGFSHKKGATYLQSECKVVFTTDSYLSFLSLETLQSESLILPQDKIIKEIIFLVTDDTNEIIDTSKGYFTNFIFIYYSDIDITITTLSLLDMLPIVVLVVLIPMALYYSLDKRKELLVPSIMGMTIFGTVVGLIPLWLTAVIIFSCICYYLIRRFGK